MTRLLAGLALVALLVAPAAGQEVAPGARVPPPREGFLSLPELSLATAATRPTSRETWSKLGRGFMQLVPAVKGLAPPTKGRFKLAVLLVAFSDVPAPAWGAKAYEEALFSRGTYRKTATGQPAFGSMADYYDENSGHALKLEGRVFDWVTLPQARATLEPRPLIDPKGRAFFTAAMDAVLARDGAAALDGHHAVAFVIAGPQARKRGSVLWPHSTALVHGGRAWRYYVMHADDGAGRFEAVGVHCHEFGHVLGLLDKYGVGRGTGLGQWCAMANGAHGGREHGVNVAEPARDACTTARDLIDEQVEEAREWLKELGGNRAPPGAGEARPLHLCAVCKIKLGWVRPVAIDPRAPQRVYLTAIERDTAQVARVILETSGREALILEHRLQVGFDTDLPRGGLLVWRTGDPTAMLRTFVPFEDVELIPAHGVSSTDAALRAPALVPFPTPDRTDLVVSGSGGGALAVRLSGIMTDAAGRLYVEVGLAR